MSSMILFILGGIVGWVLGVLYTNGMAPILDEDERGPREERKITKQPLRRKSRRGLQRVVSPL